MQEFFQKHIALKRMLVGVMIMGFGVLAALPVVFQKLGVLQWVSMFFIAAVILKNVQNKETRLRKMYLVGFLYFMGFYLTSFHWFISLYPLSFIDEMTKAGAAVVVAFAWIGLSLLQTSVSAIFFVVVSILARRGLCEKHKMLLPVGAAATYTIFEWMQTLTWAGVPWARISIGQTETPIMMKSASLFGSYFITFIVVAVNFYLALAIFTDSKNRRNICISIAALMVAVNATIGGILLSSGKNNDKTFKVAALQLNISSQEKWTNEQGIVRERLEKYAFEAVREGAELIVTSESIFPIDIVEDDSTYRYLQELARRCNTTLVIGCFTEAEGGSKNSLLFISPDGTVSDTVYSKRHLVPFGEYVPMRKLVMTLVPPLAELSMLGEDFIAGDETAIYESEVGAIGGLICFDSIYETLALDSVRDGAKILVISTNDSWFLDSAGVRMHNAQAKLRAVENGKYVVRAANTGISSIIDSDGRVLDIEDALVEGYVVADIVAKEERTLYSYIGNLIVLLCMVFVIVSIICVNKKDKM